MRETAMIRIISFPLLVASSLFLLIMLILLWSNYPENHVNSTVLYVAVFQFFLFVSLVISILGKDGIAACAAVVSLVGLALMWACDSYNLFIGHDTWKERGMPAWGQKIVKKK